MKTNLKLLTTSVNNTYYYSKITHPILNSTNYVDFTKVSKEVTAYFKSGAKKVVLPVYSSEVNTNITFINKQDIVVIYSDCQAIRNCTPNYDGLHEFFNKGFAEAFFDTKIEYIEVNELLGNFTDYE
jgi:hypothetical protein